MHGFGTYCREMIEKDFKWNHEKKSEYKEDLKFEE